MLNADLQWQYKNNNKTHCKEGSNIYFTGAFSCLQLGPTAFNIGGAQFSSCILSDRLKSKLNKPNDAVTTAKNTNMMFHLIS